jgi:hypothetical protein
MSQNQMISLLIYIASVRNDAFGVFNLAFKAKCYVQCIIKAMK